MLLLLMRHGIAEDGSPDETRSLTIKGRKRVRDVAKLLARFSIRPELVLCSHRVRARQTAEIIAAALHLDARPIETKAIDFDPSWDDFARDITKRAKALSDDPTILCVGHQPQCGRLLSAALMGAEADIEFRKAAIAGLRFAGGIERGVASLEFFIAPSFARSFKV